MYISVYIMSFRGASLEAKDINNYTPVMRAVACGHLSTVEKFLERGYKADSVVRYQKTLFEWAIENEYNVLIEVTNNYSCTFVDSCDNNAYVRHCVSIALKMLSTTLTMVV